MLEAGLTENVSIGHKPNDIYSMSVTDRTQPCLTSLA